MIEISLGKMVLLALIALIVLGPEKLPGAARTAGALMRRVRSGWDNVRAEVERELEIEEIRRTAREAAARAETMQNELKDGLAKVHEPLSQVVAEVTTPAAEATRPAEPAAIDEEPAASMQAELPLVAPPESAGSPPHDNA
jgi:sec-independent protein translocase protein TatB